MLRAVAGRERGGGGHPGRGGLRAGWTRSIPGAGWGSVGRVPELEGGRGRAGELEKVCSELEARAGLGRET